MTRRRGGRPWRRAQLQVYAEETHCWICGEWVDPSLPPNHDLARSVDHLTALADGGPEFERWNLRLAHRVHNSARGTGAEVRARSRRWIDAAPRPEGTPAGRSRLW